MSASPSYASRWAIEDGASPTFDSSSERWDFKSDSVRKTQPLLAAAGLRGTRATITPQTRFGPYSVAGSLGIEPSPAFLSAWLIRAMGGGTATAPAMADAVPEWGMRVDRTGTIFAYLGCKVSRFRLSGRAGGLVDCTIDVLGKTETGGASWASAALGTTKAYEPFQTADAVLTIDGTAYTMLDFDFVIDNALRARFANSLTADAIIESARKVTLNFTLPFDSDVYSDLYSAVTTAGLAASIALTNSTVSTTLSLNALQLPNQSPQISGDEIVMQFQAEVRGTTGVELTASADITP